MSIEAKLDLIINALGFDIEEDNSALRNAIDAEYKSRSDWVDAGNCPTNYQGQRNLPKQKNYPVKYKLIKRYKE